MPLLGQARSASSGAQAYLVSMTSVVGSGAVTCLIALLMNSQPPLVLLASSRVNLMSSEVIGEPSPNFTPSLILKVQVSLSCDCFQLSAIQGSTERPSAALMVIVSQRLT